MAKTTDKGLVFESAQDILNFVNVLDGSGLVVTDDDEILAAVESYFE